MQINKNNHIAYADNMQYNSKFIQIDSMQIAIYVCNDFVSNALKNYTIASFRQNYKFLKCTIEPTSTYTICLSLILSTHTPTKRI
jgi:hypothetical protein